MIDTAKVRRELEAFHPTTNDLQFQKQIMLVHLEMLDEMRAIRLALVPTITPQDSKLTCQYCNQEHPLGPCPL